MDFQIIFLLNSCITHDKFVAVENLLREYDDMKEDIKNLLTSPAHHKSNLFYETMLSCFLKCKKKKVKTQKS